MTKETIKAGLGLVAGLAVSTVVGSAVMVVTPWASAALTTKMLSCTGAFVLGSMVSDKVEAHIAAKVDEIDKIIQDMKETL